MLLEAMAGKRILVAEDEYFIMLEITDGLEDAGAIVAGPAATCAAALKIAKDDAQLDGAILDINLRGEFTFPVADVLLKRGVPYVFVTGYDRSILPPHLAASAFCEKPVELRKIAGALKERWRG